MNIYAHAIEENDRGAADMISEILHKKASNQEESEEFTCVRRAPPMPIPCSADCHSTNHR
jgi:hypothetical protein